MSGKRRGGGGVQYKIVSARYNIERGRAEFIQLRRLDGAEWV